jgi:hypothetical protein
MDKIVSYNEFLKHKDNIEAYLKELFDKIPDLNVYFPINLTSEERHLIYTKSKGYLFEKLHKIGSKYSIKLWKPSEDGVNSITEENSVKDEDEDEDYVTEEEDDLKEHLYEISNALEKHHNMMFNEIRRCQSSVNRLECFFTCIMVFNFGTMLILTQAIGMMDPLLNMTTDF